MDPLLELDPFCLAMYPHYCAHYLWRWELVKMRTVLYIAVFLLVFVGLSGVWLGFWAVRKIVLTEDGSIDTGVAQFVAWSFRILAASMILQSSVDPLLAVSALVVGVVIPLSLKGFFIYVHKMSFRTNKGKRINKPVYSPVEDSYEDKLKIHKLSDSNTFFSTFHGSTERTVLER